MKSFIAVALVVSSAILGILAALGAVMFFVGTALSGFGALTKALKFIPERAQKRQV
ncbi:hypothetical protein P7H20_24810 [Paenibacillus larvae]|nr:hypothetical protein [Paenibacillus larvae]MDT2277408.1 hypothetical protein [Paenibacillus larvae]